MSITPHPDDPIGLFDSGIGGATVLRELHRLLPNERLLYLADQAHLPYGPRPHAEIGALSAACTRWLLTQNAKAIVVACNTASAAALHWLRQAFPQTPFIGMVPAVKLAARQTRSGVVGVLATPGTVAGGLLRDVVEQWAGGARIIAQPCPGLAEQVEAGALDTRDTNALLERYVTPLIAAGADTLVLGCTHYPFLLPWIEQLAGPEVAVIDAAPAVALQVARTLAARNLLRHESPGAGRVRYATTGDPARLAGLVAQLGLPAGDVASV